MIQLIPPSGPLQGTIHLPGSKSLSNRYLIIQALTKADFQIFGLAASKDTEVLQYALSNLSETTFDVGHAGTSFRFLTAFLAGQKETQILTGSERMKNRPIGPLVDALNLMGARISYIEKEGFPPLKIESPHWKTHKVTISADISSQFISALLLIAPTLPNGIDLTLNGQVVSRPYIEMTLSIMQDMGIHHTWEGNNIRIAPQSYRPKQVNIESDWSAASYFFNLVGFQSGARLTLKGLFQNSLQGDAAILKMMQRYGVEASFQGADLQLKNVLCTPNTFENNFINIPDLAQTLMVYCCGIQRIGLFSGLQTLHIKETDRISSMQKELQKIGYSLAKLPTKFTKTSDQTHYILEGQLKIDNPIFQTYDDHRMAMSLSTLACFNPVRICNPEVVNKSFPAYWETLKSLGFKIQADQ